MNERNDLESFLEMEKSKFKRREKELCGALDAVHKELQSAEVVSSSEASEIIREAKNTQTDEVDDSCAALKIKIDQLETELAK